MNFSDPAIFDPVNVGGVALAMTIIWSIFSYYPFLIGGAIIVPGWIQRKFVKPAAKKN